MQNEGMDITKETVLKWLAKTRRSRETLAVQCGVKRRTVDNWLVSSQPIPAKAVPVIMNLMAKDAEDERIQQSTPQNLVLTLSESEFNAICDRALEKGQRPNDWAKGVLVDLAFEDQDLENKIRIAAEAPAHYKPNSDTPEAG